jgi:adenosylcobinamide-phosphate synthase
LTKEGYSILSRVALYLEFIKKIAFVKFRVMIAEEALLILLAVGVDLLLGDPRWFPHPVKGMGWLVRVLEGVLRRVFSPFWGGVVLWFIVVGLSFGISFSVLALAYGLSVWVGRGVEVFLLWTTISLKDLKDHAQWVFWALKEGDLEEARRRLSFMVSRDTEGLSEEEIARGVIESVAENTTDGVISPLFYAFLGGPPLAMAFKAVNTLDSMVGYKSSRYLLFGRFSALMDDFFNYIPARITGLLVPLASLCLKMDSKKALLTLIRDRRKTKSPNSGYPESAFAGALDLRLGGPTRYMGELQNLPFIGEGKRPTLQDIPKAIRLCYGTSLLFLAIGVLLLLFFCPAYPCLLKTWHL